ncbi:MAG: acylphosphatase [Candidatus Cloacimonadaceae bacterium]
MPGYEIIARGRVQGVGFRRFVYELAHRYGVKGYVQNKSDGSVLIVADGEKEMISDFLQAVKQGHRFARVSDLEVNELPLSKKYEDFFIV